MQLEGCDPDEPETASPEMLDRKSIVWEKTEVPSEVGQADLIEIKGAGVLRRVVIRRSLGNDILILWAIQCIVG